MWVVKIGGSLAGSPLLREWLSLLADEGGGRVLIVPGGGIFADAVRDMQRRWRFDEPAAHRMALLATEQYGLMLQGLEPRLAYAATDMELRRVLGQGKAAVWLSWPMIINEPSLPRDWSCSSDSLALWLAMKMKAQVLVLVKSTPLPPGPRSFPLLAQAGLLDGHFPVLAPAFAGGVHWLTAEQHAGMREGLRHSVPPGERLGA